MDPLKSSPIASGNQMPVTPPEPHKHGIGPVVGTVVIILLLAAGGLYYWGEKLGQDTLRHSIPYIPGDNVPPPQESTELTPESGTLQFPDFSATTETEASISE